ncbi:MAG: 30S ribosomal protein S20 [Desulfamplus sp.]|nr:30S ribosomal protein S20 [Desulfamplus sp.]
MANHKSAIKRAKQNEVKRVRNKSTRSAMKTAVKKVMTAKDEGAENIVELMRHAQSLIAKAGKKGVLHKNTASRKISRLTKYVSA